MSDESQSARGTADLKALLEQVQILSNQIKKSAFVPDAPQQLLAVSRAVLETLEAGGPQTVPAIAERRNSSRQNVQIVVNRLRRLGFVEFISNPSHRRSGLVRITQEGADMLRSGVSQESQLLKDLSQRIAEVDFEPAVRLLSKLQQALAGREVPVELQARSYLPKSADDQLPSPPAIVEAPRPDDYSLPYNLL